VSSIEASSTGGLYGINSGSLADLTSNAKFPNQPDTSNSVHSLKILSRGASQSGARLTGYLMPPLTGDYTFYLCTERQGALFLSKNESPLNAVEIAFEAVGNCGRQWPGPAMELRCARLFG